MMMASPHAVAKSCHARALREFCAAAETADVVSFDLFDTLVSRIFARPTDLFAAMGCQLAAADADFGMAFAARRIEAEHKARAACVAKPDITLGGIYRQFDFGCVNDEPSFTASALMELECEMEIASVGVDPQVRAAFDSLVNRRRCIITSDMYLPEACIARILALAGVPQEMPLFLSSQCGGCKRDGSVWDVVRDRLGLTGARIVHLDDNADIAGGRSALPGLTVVLLSPPESRLPGTPAPGRPGTGGDANWFGGVCKAMSMQSRLDHADSTAFERDWLDVAHAVVLPLVLGFARKVHDVAQAEGVDRIHFLARDGLIVKKAYDGCFLAENAPPSPYVLASRRCLNLATVTELSETDLDFLCSGSSKRTVAQYLQRIAIDPAHPDVIQAVALRSLTVETTIRTQAERVALRQLLKDLQSSIEARAAIELAPLLAHLGQSGLFGQKSIVVDIGWHGSLQRSLGVLGRMATGIDQDIVGVYVGIIPPLLLDARGDALQTRPWLFDGSEPDDTLDLVRGCVDLIELFFAAPENTVDHLAFDSEGAVVAVRTGDHHENARIAAAAVLHGVVARAAERLRPFARALTAEVLDAAAIAALNEFVRRPSPDAVRAVGGLSHAEGFGGSGYHGLIPNLPVRCSRWELKTAYDTASWREGFVASMGPVSRVRLDLVKREVSARSRLGAAAAQARAAAHRWTNPSPAPAGTLPPNTSILVVITAHYVENRLRWLRQALAPYERYPCPVRVIVNVNDVGEAERAQMEMVRPSGLDVEFRVQRELETPFHLAWRHKDIVAADFINGPYTHFIYIEDDIVVEPETFLYWIGMREKLRRYGLLPGFVRVEQAPGFQSWFATDQFGATRIDWMRVRRAGGMVFTNLDSPYAACFVLDRDLAEEHVKSRSFTEDGSAAVKPNWGLRERAAMGPTFTAVPRFFGSRMVVPFDRRTLQVPACAHVAHAAANYAADPCSELAKLPVERLFSPPSIGHCVRQRSRVAKRIPGLRKIF